jgi:hypothetical protein
MTAVLTERALNRALLERQWLLRRRIATEDDALDHLVGMQSQAPLAPYVGLWSRLEGFGPDGLSERMTDRRVVRAMGMLRGTIHLLRRDDALALRPVLQRMLDGSFRSSPFRKNVDGLDLAELHAVGRAVLDRQPLTVAALATRLAARWPESDPVSMAYAVRYLVPTVQVPPRGVWGTTGPARLATLESWVREPIGTADAPDPFVLRYLGAYGPASVADITTWSWLTGMREVVERLRPNLRTFRDERGRELFDVPDGALPDPDQPAPPRYLPEYDNVLLSHADRTRIVPKGRKVPLPPGNGAAIGTFLVDGYFRGTWRIERGGGTAALLIAPDSALAPPDRTALEEEGDALLRFVASDAAGRTVQFAPAP